MVRGIDDRRVRRSARNGAPTPLAASRCGRGTAWRSRSSTPAGGAGPASPAPPAAPIATACAPRRIRRPTFTAPTRSTTWSSRVSGCYKVPDALPDELVAPATARCPMVYALHRNRRLAGRYGGDPGRGGLGCTARPCQGDGRRPGDRDRSITQRLSWPVPSAPDATIDLRELPDAPTGWTSCASAPRDRGQTVGLRWPACRRWCRKGRSCLRYGGRYCWWATSCGVKETWCRTTWCGVREMLGVVGYEGWVLPVRWTF